VAEPVPVALFIPNLFLRVPVESAVRAARHRPVTVAGPGQALEAGCPVVVIDLGAAGDSALAVIGSLVQAGVTVLAFGPHARADELAAARRAGAVALPRSAFLARLPELLATALGSARIHPDRL
jgi:adenine/guanine phosphoribosyltransferase-like PRPP-binding protein